VTSLFAGSSEKIVGHVCVSDNVSGHIIFRAIGPPMRVERSSVAARTAARIEEILRTTGRSFDTEVQEAEARQKESCLEEIDERVVVFIAQETTALVSRWFSGLFECDAADRIVSVQR
jgi:hypothetical protein